MIEKILHRQLQQQLMVTLSDDKSVLLLGPRQTGKTTLIEQLPYDRKINLMEPNVRLRYEMNPALLSGELQALADTISDHKPLIVIDEVQKVSELMDVVQVLIDNKIANFVLSGSSARKLRRDGDLNLLPGRVIALRLDPLVQSEFKPPQNDILSLLLYGSLPEIALQSDELKKETLLDSYVTTYLEEEIRAEARVRQMGSFARFLELAAAESGYIVNFNKLSQEIGVAHSTITGYHQILEDCLLTERIEPITVSKTRKHLTKSQKYLIFDLGVRRAAAREGIRLPTKFLGHLFEQYVGLELIRHSRLMSHRIKIKYWRDPNGPEVDWIIDMPDKYIPIEVKWTDKPSVSDANHLKTFISEYEKAERGYIICQTPHAVKITDKIIALPWQDLEKVFN